MPTTEQILLDRIKALESIVREYKKQEISRNSDSFFRGTNLTYVNGAYPTVSSDRIVRANGTFTVTMPVSAGNGNTYVVKNCGAGVITADGNGADTIEGIAAYVLAAGEAVTLLDATAGNWEII